MKLAGFTVIEVLSFFEDTVFARAVSPNGNKVVIKYRNDPQPNDVHNARWQQEYQLLTNIPSKYLISAKQLIADQYGFILVMDDFAGVTLASIINENELNFTKKLNIACLLVNALTDIHSFNLTHRNFMPENIFINSNNMTLRLGDLSMASNLNWQRLPVLSTQLKGTYTYMAPELISGAHSIVDHRSDFYSLGIILYELFVGVKPFDFDDFNSMVQSHLTKIPEPLDSYDNKIPHEVSAIVSKLLSKSIDDRYQSHSCLLADIKHCYKQWQTKGQVDHFVIAQGDIPDIFTLSSRIYGRSNEEKFLLDMFERACSGRSELLLMGGPAGSGKSTLVNQLHTAIITKRGFFIQGNCDQYYRNRPYGVLIEAFTRFIDVLLTENEERLRYWQGKLISALGPNIDVIAELLPNITKIIGEIPPPPTLPAQETQKRFHIIFGHFIKALASSGHPLVIYLDNIQWADIATLHLASHQASVKEHNAVLVICAFRNEEVTPTHPLSQTIETIELSQGRLRAISIKNLTLNQVQQLLIDSFAWPAEEALKIAKICYQHTLGNPFYTRQLLQMWHTNQQLSYNPKTKQWQISSSVTQHNAATAHHPPRTHIESMLALISQRIRQLDCATQYLLTIAAHLTREFTLAQLAIVAERSLSQTAKDIIPALQANLLIPLDENHKFQKHQNRQRCAEYCFFHDLFRQAAYQLISNPDHQALQLKIARLIIKNTATHQLDNHLYALLEPYNQSRDFIKDQPEKTRLLAFNLYAGIKAKNASAFHAAVHLLRTAKALTIKDAWQIYPNQTLTLYKELAEAEYLAKNYQRAEKLYREGITQNSDIKTQITLYLVQAEQYQLQSRHHEAIILLKKGLNLLAQPVVIDKATAIRLFNQQLNQTQDLLAKMNPAAQFNIAQMTDQQHLFAMQMYYLLLRSLEATHQMENYRICSCYFLSLTLYNGQCDLTAIAMMHFSITVATDAQTRQKGYQLGKLALEIADHHGSKYVRSTVYKIFAAKMLHWNEPMQNGLDYLRQVIQWGRNGINLEQACEATLWLFISQTIHGTNLPKFEQAIRDGLDLVRIAGSKHIENNIIISIRQSVLALQNKGSLTLNSDKMTMLQLMRGSDYNKSKTTALQSYAILRHAYLMGNQHLQMQMVENQHLIERYFANTPLLTDYIFFKALSLLNTMDNHQYQLHIDPINTITTTMKNWAKQCPRNYQHKYLIIRAEIARVKGQIIQATQLFDQAIEAAEQAQFIHCEALANELFAKLCQTEQQTRVAKTFIREAYRLYLNWGAEAKCQLIEKQWPNVDFISSTPQQPHASQPHRHSQQPQQQDTYNITDFDQLLSINHQLAKAIDLDRLICTILEISLEHSEAQQAAMIFDEDSRLMVRATAAINTLDGKINFQLDETTLVELHTINNPNLPISVIRYVQQTQEILALTDPVSDHRFSHNDYLQTFRPASLLLIPIVNQNKLLAIIYLEHKTQANAFSPQHIEALSKLSTQIAISLINAQLFTNLNHKNDKRKAQLKRAKDKADRANETKSLFLANMSHEIRTPLTTVIGFAEGILFGDIKAESQQQAIQIIANSGKHLLLLINDILDFSKIEAGQLLVEKIDVNLIELLSNLEPISIGMAKPKSISFELDLQLPLPNIISSDPTRLNQILLNLISNAIKFTHQGGVIVKVFVKDHHLFFEVIDTGVGIKEDKISTLFFAFEQADKTVQRKSGGTGLGLTISKSLAQMLGGDIQATSELGKGSVFTVCIELNTVENTQLLHTMEAVRDYRKSLESAKVQPITNLQGQILIAEDQPENRRLIVTILEKMGLEVTSVSNGQEAIEAYLTKDFDLILLDIQMPVMDGLETFDMLTSLCNDTPVIALTANAMKHEVEEYIRKGFDDHLSKPIERKPFIHKICHYLNQNNTQLDICLSDTEMQTLQLEFTTKLPDYTKEISYHLRQSNWKLLQQDAHLLKGSAGTLGFSKLGKLAADVEYQLKTEQLTGIHENVTNLIHHMHNLIHYEN